MYNYSKYNVSNYQINFKASSKYLQKNIGIINSFEKTHLYNQSSRNNNGRIVHFLAGLVLLGSTGVRIMEQNYVLAFIDIMFTNLNFGLDKMFHNIAMRKAQALVRYIKSQGIQDEKRIMDIIDLYLKKRGGIIYSNLVRKFQKDKIRQVANGEQASQFKGLMTYIQGKYSLFTYSKAQQIKAKRNLKKLIKFFLILFHKS